jgi:hypothetical protein
MVWVSKYDDVIICLATATRKAPLGRKHIGMYGDNVKRSNSSVENRKLRNWRWVAVLKVRGERK